MPHISGRNIAHGVGGALASLNNVAFGQGGVGGWRDARTIAFTNGADSSYVSTYDIHTRQIERVYPSGGNALEAGGGHIASWLDRDVDPSKVGLRSTTGIHWPEAGLVAMGPGAEIVYKPRVQSFDPIWVHDLGSKEDRSEDWVLGDEASDVQLLGGRQAIFRDRAGQVQVVGLPRPQTVAGTIWRPRAAYVAGAWWLTCYSAAHGIIVHPFNSFEGFSILPRGDGWLAVAALDEETLLIAISSRLGEQPGEIWTCELNVAQGTMVDSRVGSLVFPVPRVDVRTINANQSQDIVAINRPVWLAWFEFGGQLTVAPHNAALPVVTTPNPWVSVLDQRQREIYRYVSGNPDGDPVAIEAAVAAAKAIPGRPVVAYVPRQLRMPPNADVIGVEAYRLVDESVTAFEARITDRVRRVGRVLLIPQCYSSNANNHADLRSVVPVMARIAAQNRNVEGFLTFSGAGRATGYQDHPEVHGDWQQLAAGIPSAPIEVSPSMQIPRVTITQPTFPLQGEAPMAVRCVYETEEGSGPVEWLDWMLKSDGGEWRVIAHNPGDDPDHTYRLPVGEHEIRLVAGNEAGTHPTGKVRKVSVRVPAVHTDPDPVDPVDPQQPVKEPSYIALTSSGGKLVCADKQRGIAAPLWADRTAVGEWEQFSPEAQGEQWALKARATGKYVRAVNGGGGAVQADAATITDDTLFTVGPGEDGRGLSFRTRTGHLLAALQGGGQAVKAVTLGDPKSWETFTSEWRKPGGGGGGGGTVEARTGVVRAERHAVADAGGPFLAFGTSLFWLPWGVANDLSRTEENLRWASKAGIQYVRAIAAVGPSSWTDRTTDPTDPGWQALIRQSTELVASFGMRVQWTLFGGVERTPTAGDRAGMVERYLQAISGLEEHLLLTEISNEGWQTGFGGDSGLDELYQLGRQVQQRMPGHLVALTAPPEDQVCHYLKNWNGAATLHYERGDAPWRPVRQPWGYPGEYREREGYEGPLPNLAINNEPIGPQSSVVADDNPLTLAMGYVVTFISQNAAYCLHTGAGVRGGGVEDRARGRVANLWEVPNIDTTVAAIHALQAALPPDMPNWDRQNAQWAGHPFTGLDDAVVRGAIMRSEASVRGGDFWVTLLDLKQSAPAKARHSCHIDVLNPVTGEVVAEADLDGGQTFVFEPSMGNGLLVRGRNR